MTRREEIVSQLTASGLFELTEDRALGYPIRIYKNAPRSLREVFQATEAYADRVFTIYGDEVMTFAEARAKVAALARFLLKQGVKKGDRVSIGMRNYPEWIVAFWACQAIGAVAVALNAWWTSAELAYAIEDSSPQVHLVDGERFERIAPLLGKLGGVAVVARRGGAPAGGIDFDAASAGDDPALPDADVGPQDVATILYTSGTTGKPKGAFATHRNHVTNIWNTLLGGQIAMAMSGAAPPAAPPPQAGVLQTFPFFHIGGLTGLYLSTFGGSKVALMYKWNAQEAAELIERYRLNSVAGVPIVVRQLLEAAHAGGRDITSLAGVASGGAPVPPDLIRRVETEFEQKTSPANGYGLTETTSAVITNGGAEYFAHPNSIGRPVPTCDARVVDENGRDVPQGEIGEIWMRGPNIIPGYWGKPDATEASFGGGWFRSGDLGYVDEEGLYYVVDRKKDVIIRGGENVYCAEVEAALLEHLLVKDAAVVGLPHPDYGEEVAAIVQARAEHAGTDLASILAADLAAGLAKFKIPTVFRIVEEDLPRTATGKVLKREIRETYFQREAAAAGR